MLGGRCGGRDATARIGTTSARTGRDPWASTPGAPVTSPSRRRDGDREPFDSHAVAVHELRHDAAEAARLVDGLRVALGDLSIPTATEEMLGRLEVAARRLMASVDELLGDPEELRRLAPSPVRIAEVIEQIVAAHDPRGHHVELDVASIVIELDRVMFERIVDNLLVNALRHTPTGCRVRIQSVGLRGGGVRVTVEDDGPGLPDDLLEQALDPATTGGPGGLAIVALLADAHNGSVDAGAVGPDGGLRVTVELRPGSAHDGRADQR